MEDVRKIFEYLEIQEEYTNEIVEKKSRFIASIKPVKTEDDATHFIEEIKKKHWNASHNCSAFVIGEGAELIRCSDDGEPSQTAGKPMLDILLQKEIRNICVVVTRYFGGTLLGTGGLVRAYQRAVIELLEHSVIHTLRYGVVLEIKTDYNGIGKIQYLVAKHQFSILHTTYTDEVVMEIRLPYLEKDYFQNELIQSTDGKVGIREIQTYYYNINETYRKEKINGN